ncbi:hypothetical protein GALMADRAFT_215518 [Galerina marginata CBS 339.88]|uniref:Uncharacterized protein n=1 Tax=Galerina marginata (strain CBS 339.88) TaxID=685588 RepID=A0A067SMR4_GALM3|nr:hypothetical protein GALMADRAFT_215518 [Galerina marginata CBS 339.88]
MNIQTQESTCPERGPIRLTIHQHPLEGKTLNKAYVESDEHGCPAATMGLSRRFLQALPLAHTPRSVPAHPANIASKVTKKARIDAVSLTREKVKKPWSALMMKLFIFSNELPKGKKRAMHRPCSLLSFSSVVKEAQFSGEATDLPSYLPLYRAASAHDAGVSPRREARAVAAGDYNSLLFVSNGCVASCNLFVPDSNGVDLNKSDVKRISIWLLNEEFDAITSWLSDNQRCSVLLQESGGTARATEQSRSLSIVWLMCVMQFLSEPWPEAQIRHLLLRLQLQPQSSNE